MFLPREAPLDLRPERLLGLRVSLNTPVVSTEEVPTGPARAALAAYEDAEGRPIITLAVRPIELGHAVFYALEEEIGVEGGLGVGIDAALTFGESLGFLFDDDALEGAGPESREQAFALWSSVVGETDVAEVMSVTMSKRPGPALRSLETDVGEELLLEELALEDDLELEPPSPAPLEAHAPPTVSGPPSLTKFRALTPGAESEPPAEPAPEPTERPRRALLARVRLIKRAAKVEEIAEKGVEPGETRLLRLLSSF